MLLLKPHLFLNHEIKTKRKISLVSLFRKATPHGWKMEASVKHIRYKCTPLQCLEFLELFLLVTLTITSTQICLLSKVSNMEGTLRILHYTRSHCTSSWRMSLLQRKVSMNNSLRFRFVESVPSAPTFSSLEDAHQLGEL